MKKILEIFICVAVAVILGSLVGIGFVPSKPAVTVEEYGQPPKELLGPVNILPDQKAGKVYQYLFRSINPDEFDARKYLARHPEDGVVISHTGDGNQVLFVFSDRSPDPNFFRVTRKK